MGSHKHGISGRSPRSPRYKLAQQMDANRAAEEDRNRKPAVPMYPSLSELMRGWRNGRRNRLKLGILAGSNPAPCTTP